MNDESQSEFFPPEFFNDESVLTPATRAKIKSDEQKGMWIAARLKDKKPDVYKLVRSCRATGISIKRTMALAGVAYQTVVEIDRSEADFIAKSKAQMTRDAYGAARECLETLRDFMPRIANKSKVATEDIRALADVFSKLVEKANLLNGEATDRVETVAADYSTPEEFMRKYYGDAVVLDDNNNEQNQKG